LQKWQREQACTTKLKKAGKAVNGCNHVFLVKRKWMFI
jgi:hypothetical protein